ncbi:potassium-transporting ATPase subunit C [Bacillus sp. ISL-75]|uniref:potassium-transporting ATPase subunit C n=1 Tax=Bacillus sp. ISL-75 TaxID=2819137 RepID=UPI001C18DE20|nr:potassium-transporting ATPase subunit C [Bacillus sp. ISL-75]MBT2730267.1 potassium-transporting ATPase subunit C [Bacillus sp. ISL-75]
MASQSTKGSELLAQEFKGPQCFHPRGSAAKYDPKASDATNAAVASKEYIQTVKDNVNHLKKENGNLGDTISTDLVTTSGSGFDPDLTPEAAKAQVPRIAKAMNVSEDRIEKLIKEHTKGRQLGIFGEPRVNVLELNIALQQIKYKGENLSLLFLH